MSIQLLPQLEHCHTWNFTPGWNFKFQPGFKKIGITHEFQPVVKRIYFYFVLPWSENIFAKICGIFYKNVLRKKSISYAVTELQKNLMLDFINMRSTMFNFKTFKIVLLATINSVIVTASLLLNLYIVLLLKFYDQRRQLDILIQDTIIPRYTAFERVKRLMKKLCKSNSTLLALKQLI